MQVKTMCLPPLLCPPPRSIYMMSSLLRLHLATHFSPHADITLVAFPPFCLMPLHTFMCTMLSLLPWKPFLYTLLPALLLRPTPSNPVSLCQGVYICLAHGRVPNKVERIRGEKTALLPARVSLSTSLSLSLALSFSLSLLLSLSDSRYISVNVLLTSLLHSSINKNCYLYSQQRGS